MMSFMGLIFDSIWNPLLGCCFMTVYSSSVSAAGLRRILSSIPILPMSWNRDEMWTS